MLATVMLLALSAGLALAKPNTTKRATVTLATVTLMPDGAQLQPGDYRLELLNDSSAPQVAFYRDGKLVCKCPVKLENAPRKIAFTKAFYNVGSQGTHTLTTLEIGGWNQVLVFSGQPASGGS